MDGKVWFQTMLDGRNPALPWIVEPHESWDVHHRPQLVIRISLAHPPHVGCVSHGSQVGGLEHVLPSGSLT